MICKGTTRVVFLINKYAFKIPRFPWHMFLQGLLANRQERIFSGLWPELCPVVFAIPGGWLTVMRRAEPITNTVEFELQRAQLPIEIQTIAESKPSNYGWYNKQLVAIDYGS